MCVCVCVCACVCLCVFECTYWMVFVYVYIYICIYMYICVYIHILGVAFSNYYEQHFSLVKSTFITIEIYIHKKGNILKRVNRISKSISKGRPMSTSWGVSFHKQIFVPSDLFRLNINKFNHFKIQLHGFLNVLKYALSCVVLFIKLCNLTSYVFQIAWVL